MTEADARLLQIAVLIRDKRLQELALAAAACAETRARLADLGRHGGSDALSPWETAMVVERHDQWLMQRRAALNLHLSRQLVEWHQRYDSARVAFGRADVLQECLTRR